MGAPETSRASPLRHIRQARSTFDARFFERHSAFWPIARAARCFDDRDDWPDVAEYGVTFDRAPPVSFARAPDRRRRPAGPVARAELYDAVIVERRMVPTRARMWHDYLNALVWATFPAAKLALHRRQHAAIERWIPQGATQLPNARTRELDALALVDEGGILVLREEGEETSLIFGHALFEGLVYEQPSMIARAVPLDVPEGAVARGARSPEDTVRLADTLLAAVLEDPARIVSPGDLPRLPLPAP